MRRCATKIRTTTGLFCGTAIAVFVGVTSGPALSDTRPTGGQVVGGDASIGGTANGLLITQTSDRAVINWGGFSIGSDSAVNFENGSGATLNRVTGSGISQIDGSLTATGSVFVLNDNGVVIGQNGVVDVGGSFVASTLGVSTNGFMRGGDQVFSGPSTASVINFGRIGALGGDVALIGAVVENWGSIVAPDGTAALVAGYDVLMRDAALADGQFVVRLGGDDTSVLNAGRIEAASAELRANQGNVLALAGNTDGIIRAEGVATIGGRIFLTAPGGTIQADAPLVARNDDGSGGTVVLNADEISLNGLIDVAGLTARQGGTITAEGDIIDVGSAAQLDATGITGGSIRIGGDLQGGTGLANPMDTATDVTVARGADIVADGRNGTGGTIILWADHSMDFQGDISATGGGKGTGGFAEVSGGFLLYDGTADLRSVSGTFGDLLLDPYNITISTRASSGVNGFTANANDSNINVTALTNALSTANVTVSTGSEVSPGNQLGNITVQSSISWTSGSNLTLIAANNIAVNRAVTAVNGGLILNAGNGISANGAVNVGLFNLVSGDWTQLYETALPAFSATDFRVSGGTFLRASANCSECTLFFEDIYGVQGIANNPDLEFEYMYLGSDIDATGTENWNRGAGFVPIGTEAVPFGAVLDGNGHAIVGLTINRPGQVGVGLFGYVGDALIDGIGLVDANITGLGSVGAIAGYAGLLSLENSLIRNSWATGTVTAVNDRAGGLVGDSDDLSIESSWARVDVTARNIAGGLVGEVGMSGDFFDAGLSDTYAVGSVTATGGTGIVGGMIGQVLYDGSLSDTVTVMGTSYAAGDLSGSTVGGLIGRNNFGDVYQSYWDSETTTETSAIGAGTTIGDDNVSLTSAEARDPDEYPGFSSGADIWYLSDGLRPMLVSTYSDEIYIPEQLQILAVNLGSDATLMRDIDLGSVLADPAGIWGPLGWEPIGRDIQFAFNGSLDGDGHIIDGLTVNGPTQPFVGLFGFVSGAQIFDLGLTDVSIIGASYAGTLAGQVYDGSTIISNIWAEGTVTTTGLNANTYTGGLIGISRNADISNVAVNVTVTGRDYVGGAVGWLYDSSLSNVYSTGIVRGDNYVGGLVGLSGINSGGFGPTTISESFSTGRVIGGDPATTGGLIGVDDGTTVSGSFWDTQTSRQSEGVGDGPPSGGGLRVVPGLTGLTTAQFQNTTSFRTLAENAGWDFTETWAPSSAGFYPELYALSPVIGVDMASATRLYGQSNAVVTVDGAVFGGPTNYIFGPDGDNIVVNGVTLLRGVGADADVGQYAFGTSGLNSTLGQRYRVVSLGGGLTINPALLTVTPDDLTKIYGNPDPNFTYAVTGFVLGQGLSLMTGELGRTQGENVIPGGYALNLGTLSAGDNYRINISGSSTLTITPRSITVSADDIQQVFGAPDAALTWTIVNGMLVFGDSLTGNLVREGGDTPGSYAILQGSLSGGTNYAITYNPGTLVIISTAPPPSPPPPTTTERGAILPPIEPIDFLPLITDPTDPQLIDDNGLSSVISYSTATTDAIVQDLQDATAYCSVIGQSEYVVDCLSERLAVIAASLPQTGDYAGARTAIDQAARQLSALVAANEDNNFPAALTRSLRPDAPSPSRPLRPVRVDTLDSTLQQAAAIVNQTQTVLLRSAAASSDAVHFQRIATAVGSSTILLRSI